MRIPKVSKTPESSTTPPAINKMDPEKQMMIHFFCDQLQKTIKDTEASYVKEQERQRAEIEQGS